MVRAKHKAQTEYRIGKYRIMSGLLINSDHTNRQRAIGGNAAAGAVKNIDLGTLGNTSRGRSARRRGTDPRHADRCCHSASTPDIGASSARWPVAASRVPFSGDRRRHQNRTTTA